MEYDWGERGDDDDVVDSYQGDNKGSCWEVEYDWGGRGDDDDSVIWKSRQGR